MNNTSLKDKKARQEAVWLLKRAGLVVFDVVAAYFSFFLSLVVRFYANGEFLIDANIYLESFYDTAPYFCALIVLVFALFGLYSRRWRYAGFYDMIRIIMAHAVVFALIFAVTYLFFVHMPMTFYFLGTATMFCLICLSRFSMTISDYLVRKYKGIKNSTANVMIVGTGDTANYVRRMLENKEKNSARVKCFFSYDPLIPHSPINGIPLLNDFDKLDIYLQDFRIDLVCFASQRIPDEVTKKITELCRAAEVDTRDYSDVLDADLYSVSFNKLMRCVSGPVRVRDGETTNDYASGEEAVRSVAASSKIESISAADGMIVVDISPRFIEKNDINEEWVRKTEADTGENISFF